MVDLSTAEERESFPITHSKLSSTVFLYCMLKVLDNRDNLLDGCRPMHMVNNFVGLCHLVTYKTETLTADGPTTNRRLHGTAGDHFSGMRTIYSKTSVRVHPET
jgi:hypothetical protein